MGPILALILLVLFLWAVVGLVRPARLDFLPNRAAFMGVRVLSVLLLVIGGALTPAGEGPSVSRISASETDGPVSPAGGAAPPAPQGGAPTAADGREFESALVRILLNASRPRRGEPREVIITERAAAGFLRFQAADRLPPGLTDPELRMESGGRLTVTATVDLDAVREQQSPGRLNPLRLLGGRLPVTAIAIVQSTGRALTIRIESTRVGSLPVPATLAAELVRIYTRSDLYPDGIDVSEPIPLPSGIDAVRVESRRTVIVQ